MKTGFSFLLIGGWLCLVTACHSRSLTRVTVRIQSGHGKKVYVERIPYGRERVQTEDSAIVEDMTRDIVFHIPREDGRLYQLRFRQSGVKFIFINDTPELLIAGNYLTGKYEVQHSVASGELKRFLDYQRSLSGATRELAFRSFADTVKNPAAFLAIYNNIEFGRDYAGQSRFITAAAARFPSSPAIRELREEVLAYIKVMEEEFQPGEQLPSITLPDLGGRAFSTGSLKGKYYLIDFWSTWCPQCVAYGKAKMELRKLFPSERFEMVSVAIDAEREDWESNLRRWQPGWPQLIDTEMWQGVAVRTLKFDSIPFNFLVDPEGRILQKGLPPDSLAGAVSRALSQ